VLCSPQAAQICCRLVLSSSPLAAAKSIGGKVHGGSQPVAGATVKLYYAGQTPTPISEAATTTTDAAGAFAFTNSGTTGQPENGSIYSCPTSNPLVSRFPVVGGASANNFITEIVWCRRSYLSTLRAWSQRQRPISGRAVAGSHSPQTMKALGASPGVFDVSAIIATPITSRLYWSERLKTRSITTHHCSGPDCGSFA
jgi:hypothetical protein